MNITAGTGIECYKDISISGGTVSIVTTLKGGIAIQAQYSLDIDNASVYCEGEVEVMESTGPGMTIGSGARMTVIQDEGYAYALYVNRSQKTSADTARLTIDGSITKPAGATIGDYETSFNVAAGNETYCETVYDGDSVALEVQINGGASAVEASDPTYTIGALSATSFTYNGAVQVPSVTVKDGSTTLAAGTHYTLSYAKGTMSVASPVDAGTYAVYVTGMGDYVGMGTTSAGTFAINPKQVSPSFALAATAYTWNGSAKTPGVTVTADAKTLVENADYTLTYASGRKNVGTYAVTVACTGNYEFPTKTLTFKVNPKGATAKAPKAAKKAITVKWAAQKAKMSSARVTGYQVQAATNKAFTKNLKKATVKGYAKTAQKLTKLKAKAKYFVRVRTYMKVGSVTYYSPWSAYAKAVKTK